ncbi:MAG: 3-keto-5-aminohexanoate cleavage protein [Thermodesulfobacteriota bacterium]
MKEKLIITAALAGGATTKNNNPATPYTPEEFAEESYRCWQEGVSIVHIHAKDPNTGMATPDITMTRQVIAAIRDRCPELIVNLSTGITMGLPAEERIAPVEAVRPDMASLNTNSMNFALVDYKTGQVWIEFVYENTFAMIVDFARRMKAIGCKPESEVFDPGGLNNIKIVRAQGDLFVEPLHLQFVYGVAGGMTFDAQIHLALMGQMPPGATYSVCGVGPNQYYAACQAAVTGGHIRIGLEDNVRLPGGDLARGSWDQARWVKDLARIVGRPVATPVETRALLGLPPQA